MSEYYLGVDVGGSKTHAAIADENGQVVAFSESGPGNHETVGFSGFQTSLHQAVNTAALGSGIDLRQIRGAGFGIAGYDWPVEYEPIQKVIQTLGLTCPLKIVNDVDLGLLAGSPRGWGIVVVSGTGCNCRGWDENREKYGRVTGNGFVYGEFAGAGELVFMALRAMAYEWTGRGPKTLLSTMFVNKYGVSNLEQLLQDHATQIIQINASDAPLIFSAAGHGDEVAISLVKWAGQELGELVLTVVQQLGFQSIEFDLVQIGSLFEASPVIGEELGDIVRTFAPGANLIQLHQPPVTGAILLGTEAVGMVPSTNFRANLSQSINAIRSLSHQ